MRRVFVAEVFDFHQALVILAFSEVFFRLDQRRLAVAEDVSN